MLTRAPRAGIAEPFDAASDGGSVGGPERTIGGAYRKATPDRLCDAVSNYATLCREYARGSYSSFFDTPCDAPCDPGR